MEENKFQPAETVKPFEDKKIKIGITLMNEDFNTLLSDVEKWELEKEIIEVNYSVTALMIGANQLGNNVNMQIKPIHCALVIYWGTVSELKEIRFAQKLIK